jgi:hypothetical protein
MDIYIYGNSPIYIMKLSVNASVPCQKMADNIKKRGSNVRKYHTYDSSFKTMVTEHTKQLTVKQQENTISPEVNI